MKTLLLILLLFVAGCVDLEYDIETKKVKYSRRFVSQSIGKAMVTIIDPNTGVITTFYIEDQKSDFELGFEAAGMKAGVK